MNFEQHCMIPVAREELWDFLLDVTQMASCVPGAENVTSDGDDSYSGSLRVKVGPIRLNLEGVVAIQERDHERWRASGRTEAKDRRVGGGASVTGQMQLIAKDPSHTQLILCAQVRFLGKLGEFGEPLIRNQADTIVAAFARNVAAHFAPSTYAPAEAPSAGPAIEQRVRRLRGMISSSFGWRGALAGLSLALLSMTLAETFLPYRLKPLPRAALPMAVTVGLTWIGARVERVMRGWRVKRRRSQQSAVSA